MSKNSTNLNKVSLLAYLINLGISVPHYCYHNNLSIAGNCRICIVEMGNLNKPVVSCAVSAGTSLFNHEIYHNSGLVKKARENVMEFLLLNHPLDCPFVIKEESVIYKISLYSLVYKETVL
jgi:NADH-quinone oxidoreductase subunit G